MTVAELCYYDSRYNAGRTEEQQNVMARLFDIGWSADYVVAQMEYPAAEVEAAYDKYIRAKTKQA